WVLRDPRMTSTVIGASSPAQIKENVAALARLDFTKEELAAIDEHARDGNINLWKKPSTHQRPEGKLTRGPRRGHDVIHDRLPLGMDRHHEHILLGRRLLEVGELARQELRLEEVALPRRHARRDELVAAVQVDDLHLIPAEDVAVLAFERRAGDD